MRDIPHQSIPSNRLRANWKTGNPNSFAIPFMDIELFKIARQGKENELQRIIEKNYHLLEGTTPRQNTALHIASRLGHTKFAEAITMECPSLLLARNCRGDTALHVAARAGISVVVGKLIQHAERMHLKEKMLMMVNKEQDTALHGAARNSHERVVHLLLTQQPKLVYIINKEKASALYIAAEGGCLKSVKCILAEVEKLPKETREAACRGPENRTPLHAAVMLQRLDIAKELIMKRKEFASLKDAHGSYPLHYASALGNSKLVEIILKFDTSVAYLMSDDGQLPIHVAARNGRINVMKEFQRFCPDSSEAIDDRGWNVLHFAVERGNVEVVKHILNSNELRELINEPNSEGNTPLHLAITKHQFSVFNLLVRDKRLDANVMNREGKTALDIAESDKKLNKKFQKILMCKALFQVGGKRGLHPIGKAYRVPRYNSYKNMTSMISMVAGFIITISFAAAFTISSSFNNNGSNKGKAPLAREPVLWLFITTDVISLITAIYIALLLFLTAIGDDDLLVASITISLKVMPISLVSLTLSFAFGLWLVLSKVFLIIFFIISFGVFMLVLHWGWSVFPLFDLSFNLNFRKCPCPLSNWSSAAHCSCSTTTEILPLDHSSNSSDTHYYTQNSTIKDNFDTTSRQSQSTIGNLSNLLRRTIFG